MEEGLFDHTRYLGPSDGFCLIAPVPRNDDKRFLNVAVESKALAGHGNCYRQRKKVVFSSRLKGSCFLKPELK